uniref:Uncharacterized protein n=1 Tax=Cacopsylla melanoneura TaxID=428564 RepID=A0A8D8ZAN2_9HEMI
MFYSPPTNCNLLKIPPAINKIPHTQQLFPQGHQLFLYYRFLFLSSFLYLSPFSLPLSFLTSSSIFLPPYHLSFSPSIILFYLLFSLSHIIISPFLPLLSVPSILSRCIPPSHRDVYFQ